MLPLAIASIGTIVSVCIARSHPATARKPPTRAVRAGSCVRVRPRLHIRRAWLVARIVTLRAQNSQITRTMRIMISNLMSFEKD